MSDIEQNIEKTTGDVNTPIISGDNNTINYNTISGKSIKISITQSIIGKTKNFVGRQSFIDKIKKLLNESNKPISIIGEAGLGKSQLAYETINRFQEQFSNIILFDFTKFRKYEKFLGDFALYLDLPIEEFNNLTLENKVHVIFDKLSKSKHVLIYTDNFETVSSLFHSKQDLNIEDARLIIKLLESVPVNTLVLLTSRIKNNIDNERIVDLEGLSKEEGREMFIKISENHFSNVSSENIQKLLEELSEKTGGHPLSIDLLARSYKGAGIPEIQKMLGHLGIGVINNRETKERLQSLDKCFEFSINSLVKNNAKLLPKLSIFSSYFTPCGAQEILGINHDSLQEFYDYGLLRKIDFDDDNPLEFRLYGFHVATKNYLQKQIDLKLLEQQIKIQFIRYYEDLTNFTYKSLSNQHRVRSVNRFRAMMQGENDFDKAMILSEMSSFIYYNLGLILKELGNLSGALEYAKKALVINEKNNDERIIAMSYSNISQILLPQGDLSGALEYAKKALVIDEKNNDEVSMAREYNSIGMVLKAQGDLSGALEYAKKALVIDEKNNDEIRMAIRYNNIGQILQAQGDLSGALEYAKKALVIDEKNNDEIRIGRDYNNIGMVLKAQGDLSGALEYAKKVLIILEKNNDEVHLAIVYNNIGQILQAQGDLSGALEYAKKALVINEKNNDEVSMAMSYSNISQILLPQGDLSGALEYAKKALAVYEKNNDEVKMAVVYNTIGQILYVQWDLSGALEYAKKALAVYEKNNDEVSMVIVYNNIGMILQDMKKEIDAQEYFKKSSTLKERLGQ